MPNYEELIDVFEKAREFVSRQGNDFSWSSWEDAGVALLEVDAIIESLREGRLPVDARVLFLPTGPLQELSLSSGWGDDFCRLADWYDEGEAGVSCVCYSEPMRDMGTPIGIDSRYAEVYVAQCPGCGRFWLRYHYEFEAESKSGRWFLGRLRRSQVENVTAEGASEMFEKMLWYFAGGSYIGGNMMKKAGPIIL